MGRCHTMSSISLEKFQGHFDLFDYMDKDYKRSSRYPGAAQAEGCLSIVLKPWHETLNPIQGFETA
ncbi:protein of unknown function [Legionella pneumophila subsp. pneumophila]|uniref:Uncharacterized protein n=1 Tax=Legionella pneumophila subsp. pneumophila TaxID=91891 RepID=A0AAV2UZ04_LEGPN|nr:protein of unknown function [Legionella pneumophila subsp. pneumophila]